MCHALEESRRLARARRNHISNEAHQHNAANDHHDHRHKQFPVGRQLARSFPPLPGAPEGAMFVHESIRLGARPVSLEGPFAIEKRMHGSATCPFGRIVALCQCESDGGSLSVVPWSVVRGPWSVVRGPWSVVRGPWSVVRGPWSVVRGPWSVVSVSCQCVSDQCVSDP